MSNPEAYRAFCAYLTKSGIDAVFADTGSVVCAFSGGADSTLLLTLLRRYCSDKRLPLMAVHVHHGIRGETADRDAAFCVDFCAARGIPFRLCKVDVPVYAREKGCGIEEAARVLRYQAIYDIAPENAAIATAHNATDQLETVLFHLCRGSGLRGLCGISPIRGRLVRPLLYLTGEEIRALCEREELPYVTDETNADPTYTRNYIRREIVPRLREINPRVDNAVVQLTEHLREDERLLGEMADAALREHPGRAALAAMPEGIRSRVIAQMYAAASPDGSLTAPHIHAVTELLRSDRANGMLDLPGGVCFRMDRDSVAFVKKQETDPVQPCHTADGTWENARYFLTITDMSQTSQKNQEKNGADSENIYKISMQQRIDFAKIKGVLCVRVREPGDTIRYGGITRRVKKLLSDRKLPLVCRDMLPVVTDDEGVVWLPGFPPRDGMAPGADTETVCTIRLYEKTGKTAEGQ